MAKLCSIDGCDRPSVSRSWCSKHYQRWRRTGDPLVSRMAKPEKPRQIVCGIEGCDEPYIARGFCGKHYRRWRLYGDPLLTKEPKPLTPPEERFWPKVVKGDGCWEWQAFRNDDGYGSFWMDGEQHPAHRIAWLLTHGSIPKGLCVLHKCDHPPCVRPEHLFLGTFGDNARDRAAKGRSARIRSAEARAKTSAAQRGRPMNHRADCDCKVCLGRRGQTCSIPGCEAKHIARGWCHKHYKRWQVFGDPLKAHK